MPPEMLKGLKPEFIAPLVGVLTAKNVSYAVVSVVNGRPELMS